MFRILRKAPKNSLPKFKYVFRSRGKKIEQPKVNNFNSEYNYLTFY